MNILITGKKRIGKSTVITDFLTSYNGKLAGFISQKRFYTPENDGIFIFDITDDVKKTCATNLVGLCGKTKIVEKYETPFETIGFESLSNLDCDLIIMDEIGLLEKEALRFKKKITSVLDSNTPVLAVIKDCDDDFLDEIRQRDDGVLLIVNDQNRAQILTEIRRLL